MSEVDTSGEHASMLREGASGFELEMLSWLGERDSSSVDMINPVCCVEDARQNFWNGSRVHI